MVPLQETETGSRSEVSPFAFIPLYRWHNRREPAVLRDVEDGANRCSGHHLLESDLHLLFGMRMSEDICYSLVETDGRCVDYSCRELWY